MNSEYTELKSLPALAGSLNTIVSEAYHLRRPPSLSESFAWAPENVERAASLRPSESNTSLFLIPTISPTSTTPQVSPQSQKLHKTPVAQEASSWELTLVQLGLKFTFHITLISVFESVFFFMYVSKLEDGGIQNTVGGFVNGAVNTCRNFSVWERAIVNDLLDPVFNASQIIQQAQQTAAYRSAKNAALNRQSWIYVGSLGSVFVALAIYARLRQLPVRWQIILIENFFMIVLLAAYEYMFFTTIISPYEPISGDEIAGGAVQQLIQYCGLFSKEI